MSDLRGYEIHIPGASRIVLEGGDLCRVRRPDKDRPIAFRPTRVIGGVSEVRNAVGGELLLLAGCGVPDPQVVVADKRGPLSIGRIHRARRCISGAAASASLTTTTELAFAPCSASGGISGYLCALRT